MAVLFYSYLLSNTFYTILSQIHFCSTLSHYNTVTLSHCPTVILSHCNTVTLSHCHTVTLSHCQWKQGSTAGHKYNFRYLVVFYVKLYDSQMQQLAACNYIFAPKTVTSVAGNLLSAKESKPMRRLIDTTKKFHFSCSSCICFTFYSSTVQPRLMQLVTPLHKRCDKS